MRSYSAWREQAPAAGPYLSYPDILGRLAPRAQGKKQFQAPKTQTVLRADHRPLPAWFVRLRAGHARPVAREQIERPRNYFFGAAEKFAFNSPSIAVNSPLPSNMSLVNGP
jgi:hypothetical protein